MRTAEDRRGPLVEYWKSQNGRQSGDPATLARALITVANQNPPPRAVFAGSNLDSCIDRAVRRSDHNSVMVGHAQAPSRGFVSTVSLAEVRQVVARIILVSFVMTFMAARVLVFLIVSRRIPDLFLHVGGTHIHHLNYGIFLLSGVGAYLLLMRPAGRRLLVAAATYGVGLALTFYEFGLWVHLGGSYWQRASFDAVVVIGALLTLIAVAPGWRRFQPHHSFTAVALALASLMFGALLVDSFRYADRLRLRVLVLEESQPQLR